MIDELDRLVDGVSTPGGAPVLLVGEPRSGKSQLLRRLSGRRGAPVFNVGASLGRELIAVPAPRRHLRAAEAFRRLADEFAGGGVLLADNIEILFDRTLELNPLDLLARQCRRPRRVVAAWPGRARTGRLTYAEAGHPEHRDYAGDGMVPFIMRR